jgi:hypothetical protein
MSQVVHETTLLAPFEIWEVMLDNSTIKFFKPLIVQPTILDRGTSGECYSAEYPELDLSAVGVSLDELMSCFRSDIRITWKRVVQKKDTELAPNARTIKRRFLECAEEVCNG